jgi:type IV pilus assembly protein PilM
MGIIQKNLVGIDIGTKNIKMVRVNSRGKVTHYAYVDFPEKVITNGRIESKQMLIETLRLARKKLGTSYKHCVLCLNSPDIVIRQIIIPQMEEIYIRKNILLELADFLPISPDKYVIDYFITDRIETEEKKQFQVLVFAIPTETVQAYAFCIKQAGFSLHYVDIMENAYEKLFRMLKTKKLMNDNNFACLYVDNSKTSISIYGNGKFFINKVIDNGVNKICDEIGEKTKKTPDLVRKLIFNNDVLTYGETFVIEKSVIENSARDISFEIMRVMDYFKSRFKGAAIETVYLSGGVSHIAGMHEYFENILGVPVMNVSDFLDPMFRNVSKKNNGIDYTNAVAVTLREENS